MLPLPAGVEVNNTFFLSYHVALLREFGPSLCQAFASCSSGEKVCLAARICYTLQHPPKLLESSRCSGDNFSRYITILSYRFSLESTGSWDGQCVNSLLISAAIAKCRGVNGSGIDMAWLTKLTTMQQGARMIAAFQAALCRNLNTRFWDDVKGRGKIHYIYISGCRLALVSSFTFHSFSFFKIFAAISTTRFKSLLLTWYVPSTSHVGDQHKGGFLYYMAIGELEDVLLNCYRQKQAFSRTVAGRACGKQVQKLGSCFFSSTQCCARGFMQKKKHMLSGPWVITLSARNCTQLICPQFVPAEICERQKALLVVTFVLLL